MSTQTATGQSFPTPCKRCGGALYRQVDACPYCGATHPFDHDDPHIRTGIPGSRASATHKPLPRFDDELGTRDEPAIAAAAMTSEPLLQTEPVMHTALVSTDTSIPPYEDPMYAPPNTAQTIWRVLYVIGALVAIGLAYVAYTLFSDGGESEDKGVEQITTDARTTTGMIAPLASAPVIAQAQTTHAPAAAKPAPPPVTELAAKPAPVAPAAPVIPATPAAPPAAPPMAATPMRPAPQFRDAGQAMQVARTAFRANDLSAAQAALAAAQTLQPGNSDAQGLADQMRPLVQRRDTALQAAQACVAQQSWPCARQHANEALAIDSGNDAAKVILERVIRETGWAPLTPPHAATTDAAPGAPLAQAQAQAPLPVGIQAPGELVVTATNVGVVRTAAPRSN
ncbi:MULTISPECIES: hypothetical protein [unclassified Paraburkholderia]|uniref:hypothetical protein n=1 Tax=unclassified Paraburkholderia TaxID=2615204 RepID=UPI0016088805|nr:MULTISPECIES: hypothetical protein [unclassified Paraburkholderia]MBB5445703.1 hypothetical protein [Paraburkholderia sp. WSM4177]MBB5486245.1 hypothetical protein [Paraburkholderia sp. WSM4180]